MYIGEVFLGAGRRELLPAVERGYGCVIDGSPKGIVVSYGNVNLSS